MQLYIYFVSPISNYAKCIRHMNKRTVSCYGVVFQAFSKHASEVLPLYNSLVAKTYDEADSSGGNSMKDWSSDSFYQGQNHSYSKPYLNFLRNRRAGSDGNESQFTRED